VDWKDLTDLTQGRQFVVERVRLLDRDVAIEGEFEPPALMKLSFDDQVFVAAFIRSHGSIKRMEEFFGVSYPTIKSRLNRIMQQLPFVEIEAAQAPDRGEILSRLEQGEITVKEALELLNAAEKETT
jgi:hypothetical protein